MRYSLDQVLIVMPAKDEEDAIAGVIHEVRSLLPEVSVLVVNDGSTDQTSALARASGAQVLDLPYNLGVGGAMRLGFRYASANGHPVMIQLDSDGQHDPANVPELLTVLENSDVAIGARFAGVGDYRVQGPRAWAMKVLSTSLSKLVGTRLTDTTSGYKAYGPNAIRLYKDDYPVEYLGDTVEALVLGHREGLKFGQVGVAMRERAGGAPSQGPWKSTFYLGRVFLALALAFLRPRNK